MKDWYLTKSYSYFKRNSLNTLLVNTSVCPTVFGTEFEKLIKIMVSAFQKHSLLGRKKKKVNRLITD